MFPYPRGLSAFILVLFVSMNHALIADIPAVGDFELFPGDRDIHLAFNDQELVSVAKGDSYYLAVWEDEQTVDYRLVVYGGGSYFTRHLGNMRDIYAIRFDLDGNRVDDEPIVITNGTYNQARPRVAWNGENFLVTWITERDAYYYDDVMAARVSPDGVVLDDPPITVRQDVTEVWPHVTSDGNNWLVAWHEWIGVDNGIMGARIAPDGTILDNPPVTMVRDGVFSWEMFDFVWAVDEYFMVFPGGGIVKGQRFTSDLQPIDANPFLVQLGNTNATRKPRVATDGTQFFVVWHEQWSYTYDRVLGARVTHGGQVLDNPPIVIEDFSINVWFESVIEWDGTYWWVAHENDAVNYDTDLEIKRILSDGTILDPDGILVRSTPHYQSFPDIQPAFGGGMHVFWMEPYEGGGTFDLLKTEVTSDGAVGEVQGVPMGLAKQQRARFASHDGIHMAVYLSEFSEESRVLAQRFDADGNAIDLEPLVVGSGPEMAIDRPGVAWNNSLYLVVWSKYNTVYGRRIAEDGSFIDPAPFQIMTENDQPDVAALGDLFLVVGSHEYSVDLRTIQAARVQGFDGTVLDTPARWIGGNYDIVPRVTAFGDRWLVVWESQNSHDQDYSQIEANFVDRDGSTTGYFTVNGDGLGDDPWVAVNGDQALIVYSDNAVYSDASIDAQLIDLNGQRIGSEIRLVDVSEYQVMPSVAWDGQQYLAAWVDYRDVAYLDQPRGDIYAARIDADGTVKDPDGVQISSGPLGEEYPGIAAEGGKFLLSYAAIDGLANDVNYRMGFHSVVEDLPGLRFSAPSPGRAGETNTFVVDGASPGEEVYFIYGFQNGMRAVPGCPGETVGIANPQIAGTAVADANGAAVFEAMVPGGAGGVTLWLQAVEPATCSVSNLISHTFP
jgi:hypothetical protein